MKRIPLHSLVIMVGPDGSGKSAIAAKKFEPYEVVSATGIKFELTGDKERLDINDLVFREIHRRISIKLELGERVVVDATNLRRNDRVSLAEIGLRHAAPVFYVVACGEPNDRNSRQHERFKSNEKDIIRGDSIAYVVDTRREDFEVVRKIDSHDIQGDLKARGYRGIMAVGDVHGMSQSLKSALDWAVSRNLFTMFLGDVIDYGPDSLECVDRIYDQISRGKALMVIGNHERKIEKWLEQTRRGHVKVRLSEGNKTTTRAIEALGADSRRKFEAKFKAMLNMSRHHWIVGNTMFVHGAAEPEMFEMNSPRLVGRFETFALFGEVDNSVKRADGYPNRIYDWVDRIPHDKQVIVGHDIRSTLKPLEAKGKGGGSAVFMDTGSGKGGHLTTADLMFDGEKLLVKSYTRY